MNSNPINAIKKLLATYIVVYLFVTLIGSLLKFKHSSILGALGCLCAAYCVQLHVFMIKKR